jgi:lipopolysaccharide transport system permease protein
MNPHSPHPSTPGALLSAFSSYRELIFKLARMDVSSRYKGSFLGLGWSFFNPILMLAVYTFVFSFVFNARWGGSASGSRSEFALVLFAGLLVHGFFAEVLNRAPSLVLNNANYVKKVIFPLEILPISTLLAAVFHTGISVLVLIIAFLALNGFLHWTAVLGPLVMFPLAIFSLGCAWFLAAFGVYVRDIGQTIGILVTVLLFMSPVFYPMSTLPEPMQWVMLLCNPLTFIIEQARAVMVFGQWPNWGGLAIYTGVSLVFMWMGFWFFQRTRRGFGDVL